MSGVMSTPATATVSAQDLSARPRAGSSAPSHVRKLAAMVDGYRSVETESAVASVVAAIWVFPACALLWVGGGSLLGGSTDLAGDRVRTVVGSTALLVIFSGAIGLWWLLRAWGNASRLGRAPRLRGVRTMLEHAVAALAGVVSTVLGTYLFPPLELIGIVLLVGAALGLPRLGLRAVNELWATSSPSLDAESGTGLAVGWALSSVVTTGAWLVIDRATATSGAAPSLAVLAGIGLLGWVGTTIGIVLGVARRQDHRLRIIIDGVEAAATTRTRRPSDTEIADAWTNSADMIGFATH